MVFYVAERRPFDVTTRVSTHEARQKCLRTELQQINLVLNNKKATLSFEYAVIELPVHDGLKTDSEDFTSRSDASPDVNDIYGEHLVSALAEGLRPSYEIYSVSSFSGSNQ